MLEDTKDYLESIREYEWANDFTDNRLVTDPGYVASIIKNHIMNGASVEDIAYYSHESLKTALTYFKVPNRSFATSKFKMAQLLVKWFDGAGYDNYIQVMLATLTVQDEDSLQQFLRARGYYDIEEDD